MAEEKLTLAELTADEQAVFMGLLREVVQADGAYSDEEKALVGEIETELGGDAFVTAMAAAKERFTSREALATAAKAVERTEARSLILSRLIHMAAADGVDEEEEKPLKWLARVWPESV